MSEKLTFDLVSPERQLFSGEVDMVTLPGEEGDMGILYAHAPLVSLLRSGLIEVTDGAGPPRRIHVRGGFAEVSTKGLTVLAEAAVPVDELKRTELEAKLAAARAALAQAKNDGGRHTAQSDIDYFTELLTLAA